MASQYGAVTGRRVKKNYVDMINAQLPHLPGMVAAKEQRKYQQAQQKLSEAQFEETKRYNQKNEKMREKEFEHQQGVRRAHMGLKAGEMGMKFLSGEGDDMFKGLPGIGSFFGKKKKGIIPQSVKNQALFDDAPQGGAADFSKVNQMKQFADRGVGAGSPSFFSNMKGQMNMGNTLGAGAMGFGVGSMFGGKKKKLLSAGLGAGLGALMGGFGGGSGGFSGMGGLIGGLSGGLGGLASSFF